MKKYWMLLGLLAFLVTGCGKKEPAITPTPAPVAAAPQALPDTAQPAPAPEATMTAKVVEPMAMKTKMPPGPYTVQVAAWATQESAQKLADFFNEKGFKARIEDTEVEGQQWYRVRIGEYGTYSAAREVADEIQEKYKSNIWLIKL